MLKGCVDGIDDSIEGLEDLLVGEAEEAKAGRLESSLANCVLLFATLVARPIDLDDESSPGTVEVHDVTADCVLAAEAGPREVAAAKRLPEHRLGTRLSRPVHTGERLQPIPLRP
jgi:hypothetical protein